MKIQHFGRIMPLAGITLLLFVVISPLTPLRDVIDQTLPLGFCPLSAAAAGARGVYPTTNAQLNASTTYNFTTSARDDSNLARTFDAASLAIEKDGMPYSTTTIPGLGQFPGTYSFENDRSGGLAEEFTVSGTGTFQVLGSYLGHQKVWSMTQSSGTVFTNQNFSSPQASGTISFWYCTSDVTNGNYFMLYGSTSMLLINMYNSGSNFVYHYYSNGTPYAIAPAVANRWYFITVGFDTSTDRANVTIDGVRYMTNAYLSNTGTGTPAAKLTFATTTTMTMYYDAVDYSWSPGYVANRSALDLSPIGVYSANSSFEQDAPFSVPAGWVNSSNGISCNSFTLPSVPTAATGHKNVLCLTDTSGTDLALVNTNFTAKTAGRIAFWTYLATTGYYLWQTLDATAGYLCTMDIQGGNVLHAYTTGALDITVMTLSLNTWYYMEISFNAGVWGLYVNGLLKQSGLGYYSSSSNDATCFCARTGGGTQSVFYLDAVDFSWDPEYSLERASYMFLNQSMSFSEVGSYSFQYTFTSSGTDYVPSWTPFTVVVPAEPEVPTHNIFFSASSSDLSGVPEDTSFLYLDGALKKWGTVDLVNGTHNVTVRDYFGVVIFSENVTFIAGGNYGIELPMATLVVNNFHDEPVALEITKAGGTGTLRQLMGSQDSFTVRLTTGTYHVRLYDLGGNLVGEYAMVTLTAGASEARDFGEAPSLFALDWMILVALIGICAILIIVTIARTGRRGREGRR